MKTLLSAVMLFILFSCTDNSAPSTPTDIDHTEVRDSMNLNRDTVVKLTPAVPDSARTDSIK